MSIAVQGEAPRMRASMARMEVPQPISSNALPCRSLSQFAYDEACCLVVPCAECHLRIDDDVIFCLWDIVVKSAVNDTTVSDNDGLEEVLLSSFSLCLRLLHYILSVYRAEEVCKCFFAGFVMHSFCKGSDTVGLLNKTFKASFTQDSGKYIVLFLGTVRM